MSIFIGDRTICKFNLRGMCRFGQRCRNIHEDPQAMVEKMMGLSSPARSETPDRQLEGACSLSPRKPPTKSSSSSSNKSSPCQPSTSKIASVGVITVSSNRRVTLSKSSDSRDKICGICFDVVVEKVNKMEQTFGLLPNCNHVYCFSCIRRWRQSKEFEFEVSKACPECRVASDFVYPSKLWIDDKDEKETFITHQKDRMKKVPCKYFRQGKGVCPFGNTCLYRHALPDGKVLDVGPPRPRRRRNDVSGEDLVHQILFWLNDDDIYFDTDDSDDDLDLDDPCIAYQYFERGDINRYIAWERLMGCDSDLDDSDAPWFLV